jgi:hypothetical protein
MESRGLLYGLSEDVMLVELHANATTTPKTRPIFGGAGRGKLARVGEDVR